MTANANKTSQHDGNLQFHPVQLFKRVTEASLEKMHMCSLTDGRNLLSQGATFQVRLRYRWKSSELANRFQRLHVINVVFDTCDQFVEEKAKGNLSLRNSQRANDAAGISRCEYVIWNRICHNRPSSDCCPIADADTRQNDRSPSNPSESTNRNRFGS